jgi:ubiquinone/menaquinone biosynthesis C-methylase UbiE
MPDVEANLRQWGAEYAWPDSGDEWSAAWGGPDAQWHSTLRPRLRGFLPAGTVLEIAPGFGRWTPYLVGACDRYVGVDLSPASVEACRARFADVRHAEFHVNDGRSLPMVGDATVDFAFSFDSLVHVEDDAIASYLGELARVLAPEGVAFLHHSNLADCRPVARPLRSALRAAEKLRRRDTGGFDQWRGTTMSARRFEELAAQAGLACLGQEVVNWLGGRFLDCISVVVRRGSTRERPNVVVHNPHFMAEAASSARAAAVYPSGRAGDRTPPAHGRTQHLGPIAGIASLRAGPWAVSVVGPLPTRRRRTG